MRPKIIKLTTYNDYNGKLSVVDNYSGLPFEIKRVFYIYDIPKSGKRGGHSHKTLKQFIWTIKGKIEVFTISRNGSKDSFILDEPNKGLYIPELTWANQVSLDENSIYCVACSDKYDENEYIREWNEFKLIMDVNK